MNIRDARKTHHPRRCKKAYRKNISPKDPSRRKQKETCVSFRQDLVNEPFDEQRIEQKHQAAQHDHRHTQKMRPKEGPQLADKPSELRVGLQKQNSSPTLRTVILKFMQAAVATIWRSWMSVRQTYLRPIAFRFAHPGLIGPFGRSIEPTFPKTLSKHLWLYAPPRPLSARRP